ncbi:MAG: TlpA family protein disulfide reductase [Planctomycetes bacterium]|nr:TlpA family protein disulfide reductase [Planctomycetota bacterium]
MSRQFCSLVLLCILCGCGGTKTPPQSTATGSPPVEKDAIATTQSVSESPPELPAANGKSAEPKAVATEETTKPAPSKKDPADKDDKEISIQDAFREAQMFLRKQDIAGAVEVLERALPGNPDDINLLFTLAQLTGRLASADPKAPDYPKYLKAAEYIRRGLKENPELVENPNVQGLASLGYYNAACALAVEKKPEEALKVLGEAVDIGFKDLAKLDGDLDLEEVRALTEFADFRSQAEATIKKKAEEARAAILKGVEELMAENKPFDFDFKLKDLDGKPIAKADFAGKVLIVDVWGTWCPPCRMEIPHFVALVKKFDKADLAMVGLNSERVRDEEKALKLIQEFHAENEMNYPCAIAGQDTLDQIPEFNAFPTTLFIDRSGKVRAKLVGYNDYELLEIIVQKLADEKAEPAVN